MSVDDCKTKCNERDDCLAFEYGVPYGGRGRYNPKDCQLQSSKDKTGCDGRYHNLDLYVKKGIKHSNIFHYRFFNQLIWYISY